MKAFSIIILFVALLLINSSTSMAQNEEPEFEMKQYYFVFLNSVPDVVASDSIETAAIQAGHMAHLNQIWKDGKCKLAGPFGDKGETRGILILDVATEQEAIDLCAKDPAVIKGWLKPVIRPWYGPANLIVEPTKR